MFEDCKLLIAVVGASVVFCVHRLATSLKICRRFFLCAILQLAFGFPIVWWLSVFIWGRNEGIFFLYHDGPTSFKYRTTFALPTKNSKVVAKLRRNTDLEPPLPLQYLSTIFRSAITPASQQIRKRTTLRWGRRCSHYSAAKRQQFWWPVNTATVSLQSENVLPGRWILSVVYCRPIFFSCCSGCSADQSQLPVRII